MVCVPCFIIPVLLYIWHKFIQPIMLRYWNPWEKRDEQGNVIKAAPPAFPFECSGGVCPFPGANKNKQPLETSVGSDGSDVGEKSETKVKETVAPVGDNPKKDN